MLEAISVSIASFQSESMPCTGDTRSGSSAYDARRVYRPTGSHNLGTYRPFVET